MFNRFSALFILTLVTFAGLAGCGGGKSPTVKPADAEKVAPDAPVGDEKPSMDEK
jgi:predicted small lipoprotein YifL